MKLGDFLSLQRGYDLPAAAQRPGAIPVIGSAGHAGYHDTARAKGPGVTIGRSGVGSMGTASFCSMDFWPHNTTLFVTDFHGNDERFAFYLLASLDLRRFDSGSAQASLNRNYIYPIEVRVPPVGEQKRIARTLGALDDKIDLNRRMNQTLESMARAIFKSWFVDDDVAVGAMDLGVVEDLVVLHKESLDPSSNPEELFDHYSIPAFDSNRYPAKEAGGNIKSNKSIVPKGAILLSKLNPRIPRAWRPRLCGDRRSISSTEFLVVTPRHGENDRDFIYSLFCSKEFMDTFASRATGTSGSHQRVRPDDLLAASCPVPNPELRRRYSEVVGPMFEKIDATREESRTLAALRDTLLPKLLSGEIRVKQAEKIVGEAT